jgi:ADP-heptose:LPS heptosyltransferase
MPRSPDAPLSATELAGIRNVCVLCWGLIGDVFVRVPTIEALKQRLPQARITVVVDPGSREVVANHPACAEVFVFSRKKRPLLRYLKDSLGNIWRLRRRHFDLSINLYSGGSSPAITRLIDARLRLGFDHTKALRRANNLLVSHPSLCGNWARAFGTVLQPLGVAPEQVRRGTSFYCSEDARAFARRLPPSADVPLVGFNLGAGAAEKRWPVARFVELARHIARRHRLTPLVFTNPGMEQLAAEFVQAYGPDGAIQAPRMTLDQVGAVMERCRYIVTGDTSLMHLAFGLKRPTLGLFTHTRPEIVAPEDSVHVNCFIEDPTHRDECGQPLGTREIPIDNANDGFDRLVAAVGDGVTTAGVAPDDATR